MHAFAIVGGVQRYAEGFRIFGPDHLGALAVMTIAAAALAVWGRRASERGRNITCWTLIILMLGAEVFEQSVWIRSGSWTLSRSLPVDLCDLAAFITAAALWTRRQDLFEFAYFWGFTGTVQAVLTPALKPVFPHPEFLRFFVLHGGIIVGLFFLALGLRIKPRRGAVWRIFGWTLVYAAVVGLIDWATGGNYFYLRYKPPGSILGIFGSWPWYIAGGTAIAAVLFFLLDLPYRRPR